MRSYLIRSFLFAIPVIAMLGAIEFALRRIPNDYSFKRDRMIKDGKGFKVLVLGNSHAYRGVDTDLMGVQGFNAANISQDHSLDRAVLERYIEHMPALEHIVLPISYASIASDLRGSMESWRIKNYVLYMDLDGIGDRMEHHLELVNRPMRQQVRMLTNFYSDGKSNILCHTSGSVPKPPAVELDWERTGKDFAERHTRPGSPNYRRNAAELERIVQLANSKGIRVHLFSPPAWKTYREHLDPDQLGLADSIVSALVRKYPAVSYLDLMADERFDQSDFGDSHHVSATGAMKLSRILAEDISSHP